LVVVAAAFAEAYAWQPPRSMAEEMADMARARRTAPATAL